jgi:hypothetical protein
MRFVARRLESIPCPGECKGNWATVAIWLTATRTGAFGRSTTRGRSKVVLAHHKCPPSRPYPTDMRANGRDRVESIPMPCPLGCNPRAPCPIADSGRARVTQVLWKPQKIQLAIPHSSLPHPSASLCFPIESDAPCLPPQNRVHRGIGRPLASFGL